MFKHAIWERIEDLQTVNTIIFAENDYQAKKVAEVQYGVGNVLGYSRVD